MCRVALCRYRVDSLAFLQSATSGWGSIVTKPFEVAGSELQVNFEITGSAGKFQVGVLHEERERGEMTEVNTLLLFSSLTCLSAGWVTGFEPIESVNVGKGGIRVLIKWRNKQSLKSLRGQVVRLQFYIRQANLYSFQII